MYIVVGCSRIAGRNVYIRPEFNNIHEMEATAKYRVRNFLKAQFPFLDVNKLTEISPRA